MGPQAIFITAVLFCTSASAAEIITPEKCIVDALKGNAQPSLMLHYNCVMQYIHAVEPTAEKVPIIFFDKSKLIITAGFQEQIVITLQNKSAWRIVSADIAVVSKANSQDSDIYRVYAESPVEPFSAGKMMVQTNFGIDNNEFAQKYSWSFVSVYGVKP